MLSEKWQWSKATGFPTKFQKLHAHDNEKPQTHHWGKSFVFGLIVLALQYDFN